MFGFHFPPFGGQFAFQDADMMDDEEMIPQKEIDNKELYDILEIPPQSDIEAVKKCYKILAKKYHPDRPGGNQQKFQLIQKAYEVLSDPDKKKTYDKYGKQGLLRAMNMKNQQFKKCEPYKIEHKITLKDVYQGAYHKKVIPDIQKLCTECQGQGGKKSTICNVCQGHKIILMRVQVQPGLEMNQQAPCHQCKAKGKMISQSDICKKCDGQGCIQEQVEIEIPIEKGVPDGYCVKLYGQGNQREGYEAGDIFVYLNIEQHSIYIRKGTDLFYQKRITLKEALTGVNLQLQSLDDKDINITTKKIIKPNQILTVKDHGIPFFKDELRNGDLHIQFYVDFPETLDSKTQIQIAQLLPGPQNNILNNPHELQEFSMDEFEKHQQDLDDNQDDENHEIGIDCSIF